MIFCNVISNKNCKHNIIFLNFLLNYEEFSEILIFFLNLEQNLKNEKDEKESKTKTIKEKNASGPTDQNPPMRFASYLTH